jgi:flagellar biosynthetic protein FliR
MDLSGLLTAQFLTVALVFARIGAAVVFMPGFGETFIPTRHRLAGAVLLALAFAPIVQGPPLPDTILGLLRLLILEVTIGIWIGMTARIMMTSLQFAGAQIGMMAGLSNAFAPDMGSFQGSTLIATAFLIAGIALIFASDMHHLIIEALIQSYDVFPAGTILVGDLAQQMVKAVSASFYIGLGIVTPFIIMAVVMNLGLGLANRMMPSLPVFFVAAPVLIGAGLFVLVFAAPSMLRSFATRFTEWLGLLTL